jgi:hypothetical protein
MKISLAMKSRGGFSGLWFNTNNRNSTPYVVLMILLGLSITIIMRY